MTKILIKRLSKEVPLPKYETSGSSGMDLAANIEVNINIDPGKTAIVPTGLSISIPKGFEVQIRPRSGLAAKQKISVLNTPGTSTAIDTGEGLIRFQGEINQQLGQKKPRTLFPVNQVGMLSEPS